MHKSALQFLKLVQIVNFFCKYILSLQSCNAEFYFLTERLDRHWVVTDGRSKRYFLKIVQPFFVLLSLH